MSQELTPEFGQALAEATFPLEGPAFIPPFGMERPIMFKGPGGATTHYVVPPPSINSSFGTLLDPVDSRLHENTDQLYEFAHHLCYELDGAHRLADGHHAVTMGQYHELSVKFNSLKADHVHLINDHLIPLQRFAAGVISSLSVLSGTDPISTHECANGGCVPPPQSGGPLDEERPASISPIPIHLRAFGLDPTDYANVPYVTGSPPSSVPDLISISSSSEESILHPSTPSSPGFSGEYLRLRRTPHWSDVLLAHVNFQNYYFLAQEEAFILSGESGESEAIRSTESDASGSGTTSSDGSEEVLAEEAEGVWPGDGAGGI